MDRNRVFISYPTDDLLIASAINEAVLKMPEGRLDTFLDRENIGGGELIPKRIKDALRETVYFVGVATNVSRRSFDWCGLELGFYQGSYDHPDRREGCLFHLTYPGMFAETKNFKVQSLLKEHRALFLDSVIQPSNCEIYSFLKDIAELNAKLHPPQNPQKYFEDIPDWCENYASVITNAFFIALLTRVEDAWYPQARINISVENGEFYKEMSDFPSDAQVTLSPTAYIIFCIGIPDSIRPMTWDEFKALLGDNAGNNILGKILFDVAYSALPSKADAKGDYVYQAPNQLFYRVLLVKHSVYGSKRREFTFNLIRTLEKVKSGSQATTALVAGIVLGSKYRSLFLEDHAKYALAKFEKLEPDKALDVVNDMLQDIDRINADAAADGLANYTSLQTLLGDDPAIKELFDQWWSIFPQLETAAKNFVAKAEEETLQAFVSSFEKFIDVSRRNNHDFLTRCLDAYRKAL